MKTFFFVFAVVYSLTSQAGVVTVATKAAGKVLSQDAAAWSKTKGTLGEQAKKHLDGDSSIALFGNSLKHTGLAAWNKTTNRVFLQFKDKSGGIIELPDVHLADLKLGRTIKDIKIEQVNGKTHIKIDGFIKEKKGEAFKYSDTFTRTLVVEEQGPYVILKTVGTEVKKGYKRAGTQGPQSYGANFNSDGTLTLTHFDGIRTVTGDLNLPPGANVANVTTNLDTKISIDILESNRTINRFPIKMTEPDKPLGRSGGETQTGKVAISGQAESLGLNDVLIKPQFIAGPTKISTGQSVNNLNIPASVLGTR